MNGENPAIRPIQYEKRGAIFLWEIAFRPELHSGRRADADIINRRQAIEVIFWPLGGARAPAVLAPSDRMNHAGRAVPRQPPIPFHVTVEREDFSIGREIEVIGVPEAGQHELPFLALRIGTHDVTSDRKSTRLNSSH